MARANYLRSRSAVNGTNWSTTWSQPGDRAYQQRVDWVYFAENEVVSLAQVNGRVNGYRGSGVEHVDSVR